MAALLLLQPVLYACVVSGQDILLASSSNNRDLEVLDAAVANPLHCCLCFTIVDNPKSSDVLLGALALRHTAWVLEVLYSPPFVPCLLEVETVYTAVQYLSHEDLSCFSLLAFHLVL